MAEREKKAINRPIHLQIKRSVILKQIFVLEVLLLENKISTAEKTDAITLVSYRSPCESKFDSQILEKEIFSA